VVEGVSEHLCWNSYAVTCCVQQIKCAHKKMWSSRDVGTFPFGFCHFTLSVMFLIQEVWVGFLLF